MTTHDYTAGATPPSSGAPAPAVVPEPDVAPPPGPKRPGRDRYLDLLRSIALVRVVAYHLFGWAWLTVLFPSMGVMFALAGSLMARSLSRPAWGVIRGRVRRLLPPALGVQRGGPGPAVRGRLEPGRRTRTTAAPGAWSS